MLEDIEKYIFHDVFLPAPFCLVGLFFPQRRQPLLVINFDNFSCDFDIFPYLNYDLLAPSYSVWSTSSEFFSSCIFGENSLKYSLNPNAVGSKKLPTLTAESHKPRNEIVLTLILIFIDFGNSLYNRLVPERFHNYSTL